MEKAGLEKIRQDKTRRDENKKRIGNKTSKIRKRKNVINEAVKPVK
jgi:hypothetical protein